MKLMLPLTAVILSVACIPTGCQSPKSAAPVGSRAALTTRNNCYSLLHQLLAEHKDVSLLRFIKPEHLDVNKIVNRIATTSGTGARLLEEFARRNPSLALDDIRLPPGEAGTRDAIAATKKKELLGETGDEFELTLLLTQTEALSYTWRLARVTSESELQPGRARALLGVSEDMHSLYQEVFALLLSKTELSAANQTRIYK